VLVTDAVRARHAERLERDPALHGVMVAAADRVPAHDAGRSLDEAKRRAERERIAREDQALERALHAALAGHGGDRAGTPAELLWRELMLVEAERVLADSIDAAPRKEN
jgi:hypothetical protein